MHSFFWTRCFGMLPKGPCLAAHPHAGGTALSMNWDDVGKKDYSKKGKEGEEEDEDWAPRSRPSTG